jgi:hypothetical protein
MSIDTGSVRATVRGMTDPTPRPAPTAGGMSSPLTEAEIAEGRQLEDAVRYARIVAPALAEMKRNAWILRMIARHPEWNTPSAIGQAIGVDRNTVHRIRAGFDPTAPAPDYVRSPMPQTRGRRDRGTR